jgi:serine O-acetyltransferase
MSSEQLDSAAIWNSMRASAELSARNTPLLAAWLEERVLRHQNLTSALASQIAAELADELVPAPALAQTIAAVLLRAPQIVLAATRDLEAFVQRDPSCDDALSAFLYYKGFRGLEAHRVAHALWVEGERLLARYLQARASVVFALDIHPAARIGAGVFIDHGTAIVIGETAVVGDDVSILHSVTLGGTGKESGDRHPKIGAGVLLGAGACVLGNVEVGDGSKVAAGSVVLRPVPSHTTVAGVPARVMGRPRDARPALSMAQDIELDDSFTG